MAHKNPLRKDKTCLNCNHVVAERFCPNCGQENTDTRKTFFHLFVHFFEDLTHYENAFWKTIKNLIFKPASLTNEYLSGRRMSYLAPVRLYIFVSFVTFFLLSVLPDKKEKTNELSSVKTGLITEKKEEKDTVFTEQKRVIELEKKGLLTKKESDSLQKFIGDAKEKEFKSKDNFTIFGKHYKSVHELDSVQQHCKPSEKMNALNFWLNRKIQVVQDKYSGEEIKEKFVESFVHNLPKSLFLYMPLFAFLLWLFQNKKRWYYFDHGIFTLHYFSFLLLGILIISTESYFIDFLDDYLFFRIIDYLFKTVGIIYMLYYFFPAHHRFYGDTRIVSIIKGIILFFINIIFIFFILTIFAIYTFINIH